MDTGTTGVPQPANRCVSIVGAPTTLGNVTNVYGGFGVLISTSSRRDPDADVSSPSTPDESLDKGKASYDVDNAGVKLGEVMMASQGLDYLTAKAAANHL
jgi:hypothetical protein